MKTLCILAWSGGLLKFILVGVPKLIIRVKVLIFSFH